MQAQTDEAGTYGTFSIKTNGEWEYELDNSKAATNALAAAATVTDAFSIASADGTEGTVTITVTGANDAPTADAGLDATVAEGASVTLDGTGSADPDADTTLTYSWARKSGETDNAVTLTNADKASASFTAPDDIAADVTLTFVLTVSDGTTSDTDEVVITVTGANAAATFSGDLTGEVTEDDEDKDEASGTVTVSDSDGADTVQAQTDKAGTYGTFSITTAGVWTYTLDNDKDETDALAAAATVTDAFAIQSADDTAGTVTITVTGANDAPTADAGANKTVIEGASVTLDGTDSSDPDASTTLTYSWARKSGETDNAVTLTNADKASASFTAPNDIVANATLTFVLTVSDGTASATDEVVITVTGANAAATFSGDLTGAVTEDDDTKDEATGTVAVTDSDGADTVQAQTDEAGTYGTFSIKTNGEWTYTLDNTDDDTNALAAAATVTDTFAIAAADGTEGTVTITVTGANDAPTADAGANKTVAEGASVTLDGTDSSDPDASTTLTYAWARKSGETDNAVTLTNADTASASFTAPDDIASDATLTFVLTVSDGTASDTDEVTITVTGANAAATIGGDLTGEVTEDDDTKDEASGTVTVTDSDGADTVQAQTGKAGTYGTFSIKTNGEWTYTLDNEDDDTNALASGATAEDTFAIAAADGTAGTVTITVTGANDAPTANAGADKTVTEGASVTLDGMGSSDPDTGHMLTYSWARKAGETDNAVTLTNADKASASFTAPDDIASDATLTFVLTVSDGTASDTDEVTITVTGANAAATIGGDLTGDVTEDDEDKDEASGTVAVTDSDGANTVQAQTDEAGTYGTFSIESDGDWTYTLDNTDDDTNALAAGATATDAFSITSADGTEGTVTITVTGANDAPTADAGLDATVAEGASVTLDGTDSSDSDASTTLTYSWARKAGETDNAVTLTNANTASASFTAPNDIAADVTLTFVLTVSDGTASHTDEVIITVTGVNAAATIGGTLTGAVTEDDEDKDEASGTVTITDSDGANTVQAQTDEGGTYGTFSIKANGEWKYELDNTDDDTNALAAAATATDAFSITSADGTEGTVTITVTGANDAPTANAGADATVAEGASVTLDGTGSTDPDASTTLTYAWARKTGETNNAVTLTNANTASASFTAPDDIAADATLTFVLTVSDGTASATDEVVIIVTGVNAAATIGGDLTGAVTEDDEDKDEASGTVTVSDSDGANRVQAQTDKAGTYGTFSITTAGVWTYTLDNDKDETDALAAGATVTDAFAIQSADDTAGTVTITVTGANDAPTANAGADATVAEGASVTLDGTGSSDPDASTTLTYSWARKAGETDNAVTLTNADKASASFTAPDDIVADATLTFVLTVSDGTASDTDEVIITVTGVNAAATFGGTLTGEVTEDDEDKDEAEGTVTVDDSDGADTVQAQTDEAGTYGTFNIKTNGEWTYTLDNTDDDTNALTAGTTAEDAFAIAAADGTTGTVTITVTGANDAPTADAGLDATVAEGASVTLNGTGSSDPDASTTLTYSWARKAGETDNAVTLTNADKASASFTAPDDITANVTLTFVLTVSDGTASDTDEVVITVTGANAAATIGGTLTGEVTEDDDTKDEATGTVTVTDSDGADTVQAQTDEDGIYGTFSIESDGDWTYTLDNSKTATNALASGATAEDTLAIAAADGTTGTVTITVTGANDAPTADAGANKTVIEGASVTLDGTGSSDPDASTTLTYFWTRKSGETDNAVTLTNTDKASASFTAPNDIAANATLTFVLTVSDGTASDIDEVVITVTGANAAATFGGDLTGEVTEDDEDKDEASGTVTVTDSDGADTVQAQTDKAGTYGTFSIKANGEWTYTLDNEDDDTNALAAGATAEDAFAIASADGTAGTVTITVTGANDAPTADAGADTTVTEGAPVTLDGTGSSDPDASTTLTYSWARKAGETDNAVTLTNADKASASFTAPDDIVADATLTFVLTVSDGTASDTDEVVITVTGANAAATFGGTLTGAVTEDDDTKDEASGTVTVTDSDGDDTVQAQTDKAGTYGTFSIKANGEWTYTLDNEDDDTNALAAGATVTDTFPIASADGTEGTVTITVTGANDAPTADAGADTTVTEGVSVTLDGTGSSDPDASTTLTYAWARKSGETDNAVTLTNADKASASFTAPDDIVADATLTFVLTVSDGTASDTDEVIITVTGVNAAATFGGTLTGEVTEDDEDKDEASGTVTVDDSDGADTVQAQTDKAGTYGTFSIKTNGEWTYTLDNTDDDTNALAAGATKDDAFAIASADGTAGTITITVTGANDAPTADAGANTTVTEGASVTLDGTGSSDPDASTTLTYSWARKSGETDNAVTLTNADKASASFTAPNDIAANATLTFVLTVSDGTASATDEVVITVTGANAAATFGGDLTGAVTEDDEDKDEASGTVTVDDSDGADTVQAQTDKAGTYGTFSIKTNGEWTYTLDNTDDDTNALAAGATVSDAFAIQSADDTAGTVTITVTGANDAPTADAGANKTVIEGASVTLDGTGSDPDASTTLTYSWARKSGETDNAVTLTNADKASASFTAPDDIVADATLTFVLTVSDGTVSATDEVVITVTGANAAATFGGTLTGEVTEDDEDKDEASGTVTVTDSDGADTVQAQTDEAGTYGMFSIKTNGEWTYTLDNTDDDTNALASGATAEDTFAIAAADGTAGTVTITVTGANDAPTADAGANKTVAEGASVTLDGTGSSDPDASTTLTYSWARKSGETDNAVTLTNADKASASFTAPNDIVADATLTFVLTVSDGTASDTDEVTITVTGANAAATIGGTLTGEVAEDDEDKDEASSTVTVTDSDGADTVQAQTDEAGTYGTFSIKTNGEWTYTLDNADDDTNALTTGATATDAFSIASADGTEGTVTITVTGANDAPTADAGADTTVVEGASVTLDGTGSSDPDVSTTLTYSWARKAGETDNAVTLSNADKASASFTAPDDIVADATLTFVLTVSDGTASATDEVVITVTGANAAATFSGDLTGDVTEDDEDKDEASGTVTVSDSDGANTVQAQTDEAGTYGTFSIETNGEWTYTLDNSKTATNALAADATVSDAFAIQSADSTAGTVTITVTGANDAPTADAGADTTVAEGATVTLDGTDSSDPDASTTLTYSWARKSGETDNAVMLTNGDTASASFSAPDDIVADVTLTFVLTVSDGAASDTDEVVITVTGVNAAAAIGGDLTGAVTEDDEDKDEASGTVTVTDSDGADTVQAQTGKAGTYGTFSIKANGEWEYELDNSKAATNALAAGTAAEDAFEIAAADGTTGTVTITVTGADDAPTVTVSFGAATYSVTEGEAVSVAVTLSADPERSVTIPVTRTNGTGAVADDYNVSVSVAFASGETLKTLTFSATDDLVDESDETVTLGFGTLPARVTAGTVSQAVVTITDNDDSLPTKVTSLRVRPGDGSLSVSWTAASVAPNGYSVRWRVQGPGTLLSAINEVEGTSFDIPNLSNGTTYVVRVDTRNAANTGVQKGTNVSAVGTPVGLEFSARSLVVPEGGSNTYTVKLTTLPTGDVTVTVGGALGDVSVSPGTLTFTTDNWSTAQAVTVGAAQDNDVEDDTVTLSHTAVGGGYEPASGSVTVTVDDDDTRGVTVSPTSLTVAEGSTGTYMVVLNTQPTGDVTVTVGGALGDVSVSRSSLVFTPTTWNQPQTVTVSVAEDDDALTDDTVILTHRVTGADYASESAASVTVIITENDARGVTVSPTSLTVAEGATGTYTVVLDTQPTGDVTVAVGGVSGDVSVSRISLVFTPTNWNQPQTVTVTAAQDDDATDDMVTLTHRVTGADYASESAASVEVTIIENDTRGVTVSPTSLTVAEGSTGTYTVVLNTQPTGDVTVTVGGALGDVSVSRSSLVFTPTTWNQPQTVTVSVAEDDDALTDDMVTLTHGVSGADYSSESAASVEVTITEKDVRGVTVSPTFLTVAEGSTGTYTVVLNTQPTGDVTVAVGGASGDVSVSRASLVFTPTTWNQPQTVTVSAAEDDDALTDDTVILTHRVTGADYASESAASVTVIITENDARGVTVSPTSLTVAEGATGTYTVVLDTQPTGDVTVAVGGVSGDVSVSRISLVFTPTNWNQPQTVTVTAAQDDDATDDMVTLTHRVTGADYASESAASVEVTIIENDTRGVTVSPTSLTVAEGSTGTYTVVLNTQPTGDVTVTVGGALGDVSVSRSSLVFTPTTWNQPQTVTVSVAEDDDALTDDMVTLTHGVSGADYSSESAASVEVTITEKDVRGVTVSPTFLTVAEGSTGTYTVVLNTQPTGDVTVTVGGASGDVSMSRSSLVFTSTNWNQPQTVTVTAAEDDDALTDDTVTLTHRVSGADYASESAASVTVTITENDTRGVTVSPTSLTVAEGSTGTYTVVLDTQPTGDVTVTVGPASGDVSVSTTSLVFTSTTWNQPQTVTVSVAEDDDALTDDIVTLTHRVSGADYASESAASVEVTITENDVRGVTVSPTSLTVAEGSTGTYTVVLNTQPTGDVTVTVGGASGDASTSPTSLVFTSMTWNQPQTVTVSVSEDDDALTDDTVTLTHRVSGADYASESAASVTVTITENDTRGVTVSPTSLTVAEGSTGTYTVVLNTQPTGDVTVAVGPAPDGASGDASASPTSLTFTPTTWNQPQAVTVTAAQDDDATDDTTTLTHTASGGDYNAVTSSLRVQVDDDDERGIVFDPPRMPSELQEGSEVSYGVSLLSEPSGMVRVSLSSVYSGVSVSPTTLTFNPATWQEPQAVTLHIARGAYAISPMAMVQHLASGADYEGVSAQRGLTVARPLSALSVSLGVAETGEEGTDLLVPVLLSSRLGRGEQIRVRFAVGADGDTATAADYRVVADELVFVAGGSSETLRIEVLDDALSEPEETLTVSLLEVSSSNARRKVSLSEAERTYRIAASDALSISLGVSTNRILEGGDSAVFRISLSGGELESELPVGVFVHPGSTADASDVAGMPAFVMLASGEREAEFAVSALQEAGIQNEGEERLTLTLGLSERGEIHATLVDATASVVIGEIDSLSREAGARVGLGAYARSVGSGLVEAIGARSQALEGVGGEFSSIQVGGVPLTQTLGLGREGESAAIPGVREGLYQGDTGDISWHEGVGDALGIGGDIGGDIGSSSRLGNGYAEMSGVDDVRWREQSSVLPYASTVPPVVGLMGCGAETSRQGFAEEGAEASDSLPEAVPCRADSAWEMELAQALQQLLAPMADSNTRLGNGLGTSSQDLLSGSEFLLTPAQSMDSEPGRWAVWGQGSLSRYNLKQGDDGQIDGDLRSTRVGFDMRFDERRLAGLVLSRDVGRSDLSMPDGQSGSLQAETTGIYPYVHWRPRPKLGTWGAFGYGAGKARLDDGVGDVVETDIELGLLAAGVHQDMLEVGSSSWALHSDAFLVKVDADEVEGGALLPSTSARAWRLRTALEVQMGALSSPLSGRVELGLRFDGGDAAYDGGVEAGGSLAYVNPDAGIEVRLRGRWMTSLQSSRADERGVSLNLTYDAGMMNRGWMLTASPEWGETSAGTGSLWDSVESLGAVGVGGLRAGEPALRLPVRVGYGVGLGGERVLTPFAEWTSMGELIEQRVGVELALPFVREFDVEVGLYKQQVSGTRLGDAYHTGSLGGGYGQGMGDYGQGMGDYGQGMGGYGQGMGGYGQGMGGLTGRGGSGYGQGGSRHDQGMSGLTGRWGSRHAGSPVTGMTLEALLSRSLNDGYGRFLFGTRALNVSSSFEFEVLMHFEMRF